MANVSGTGPFKPGELEFHIEEEVNQPPIEAEFEKESAISAELEEEPPPLEGESTLEGLKKALEDAGYDEKDIIKVRGKLEKEDPEGTVTRLRTFKKGHRDYFKVNITWEITVQKGGEKPQTIRRSDVLLTNVQVPINPKYENDFARYALMAVKAYRHLHKAALDPNHKFHEKVKEKVNHFSSKFDFSLKEDRIKCTFSDSPLKQRKVFLEDSSTLSIPIKNTIRKTRNQQGKWLKPKKGEEEEFRKDQHAGLEKKGELISERSYQAEKKFRIYRDAQEMQRAEENKRRALEIEIQREAENQVEVTRGTSESEESSGEEETPLRRDPPPSH